MRIAPGEPVPPGCEDEFKSLSKLEGALSLIMNRGLVGIEYIVELQNLDMDLNYHCFLCNEKCEYKSIKMHIDSISHRIKFLVIFQKISIARVFT